MNTLLLSALLLCSTGDVRYPPKPGPREFILDEAKLLSSEDAAEIRTFCDEALSKKRAPIIVVTIPSLEAYGAGGWPIERYALNLMSEWGVGWEDWDYGMLFLVSKGNRKARIELGASWARRKDDDAKRILGQHVIPLFKNGDYSKGILEGVRGLRGIALDDVPQRTTHSAPVIPPDPYPRGSVPGSKIHEPSAGCFPAGGLGLIVLIVGGVLVLSFLSRMLRGGVNSWGNSGPGYSGGGYGGGPRGGWFGSSFGGGFLGGALGSILADQYDRRHSQSSQSSGPSDSPPPSSDSGSSSSGSSGGISDSSFGGGSFGGGFSGGGGATGEW
ncbi:MAG TPA: TPM domain-containing protein [Planctomycetota bacterium]|nr:TPM domain-containing protein [Planctomycetota bacterium]